MASIRAYKTPKSGVRRYEPNDYGDRDPSWGPLPNATFYFGRPGDSWFVYVLESDYGVKVGIAGYLAINRRLDAIGAASGLPVSLVRCYLFADKDAALSSEREAHRRLAPTRTRGEWFHCHPFEATAVMDRIYADARMAVPA